MIRIIKSCFIIIPGAHTSCEQQVWATLVVGAMHPGGLDGIELASLRIVREGRQVYPKLPAEQKHLFVAQWQLKVCLPWSYTL